MNFNRRKLKVFSSKTVALNIWGITGMENFWAVLYPYFKGAHGIVLFYDTTDKYSFQDIEKFIEKNTEMISELSVPIYVVEVSERKVEKSTDVQSETRALAKKIGQQR